MALRIEVVDSNLHPNYLKIFQPRIIMFLKLCRVIQLTIIIVQTNTTRIGLEPDLIGFPLFKRCHLILASQNQTAEDLLNIQI